MEEKEEKEEENRPEKTRRVPCSALPSLDGFSLEDDDLLRVSRRVGDRVWKEYFVSFGELVRAVAKARAR